MAEESAPDANDLPELYVNRIQPVMYRIGSLWADGEVSVAQEHMATAVVSRIIAGSYQRFQLFERSRGTAIVSCATDEFHELGARTVADLLELDGWDVTFVGANLPERDLHRMVVDARPEIVALSATVPSHLLRMKRMVDRVNEDETLEKTRTMVGGLAFSMAPEAFDALDVDGVAEDGHGARKLAAKWWENGVWN
jgi:methanogenic corrinoid protein MtbC1